MKKVVSVSLGDRDLDMRFRTRFLGETFQVTRIGTDGDAKRALQLVRESRDGVDALGLGMVREHYTVGTDHFVRPETRKLEKAAKDRTTCMTLRATGDVGIFVMGSADCPNDPCIRVCRRRTVPVKGDGEGRLWIHPA